MNEKEVYVTLLVEASDERTSPQRLAVLSQDPALRSRVAANPSTPPETLELLSTNEQAPIRRAVALRTHAEIT